MATFFIIILGVAVMALWGKVQQLQRRLDDTVASFQSVIDGLRAQMGVGAPVDSATVAAEPIAQETEPEEAFAAEPLPEREPEPAPDIETAQAAYDAHIEEAQRQELEASEPMGDTEKPSLASRFSFDFEDIFGRRLPIWAGGFALAIAGIFLVRYSIEAGLVTPTVRVVMSFVFGLALLAGAEGAFRFEDKLNDPRVRQALAGAGLATLYGAFYLAGTAYGLIGAGAAFAGLAAVTAAAITLSFRFGLPCAVIGLIGGFAAPLLVDSDTSNIPLLSFYLALVTGGLAWTGQSQGRSWMGYAALALGLGWGVLMMFAGISSTSDFAALGVYLVVLGTVLPAFLHMQGGASLPKLAAGAVATLQMAVLVSDAGFAPLTWGLYLLIGAALSALGWRYPALRLGAAVAAGLGLWLLFIWPTPEPQFFVITAAAQAAIFAGVPLTLHWRKLASLIDLGQLSVVALGIAAALYVRLGGWNEFLSDPALAASFAALAVLPAAGFAISWMRGEEGETRPALILLGPAAVLAFAALLLLTPAWLAPVAAMIVTAALLALVWKREALSLNASGWAGAAVTALTLAFSPGFEIEAMRLGSAPSPFADAHIMDRALIRWAASVLPFAALAWIARNQTGRSIAEAFGVALTYGVIAQFAPTQALAWIAAAGAIALFAWKEARMAAWGTAVVIAAFWALIPLSMWSAAGAQALAGMPFLADNAVTPHDLGLTLAPLAAALGFIGWRAKALPMQIQWTIGCVLGLISVVALHSLYKQAWGITSLLAFEHYGMGERTIWQALLMLAAYALWQFGPKIAERIISAPAARYTALAAAGLALAHFTWFTLFLHNPLLTPQHVGPTPIANWLTLSFVTAIAGLWLASQIARQQWPELPAITHHIVQGIMMGLITLLGFSLLRQTFAGTVLTSIGISQNESLLISLLGIVIAIGFLAWGSLRDERSWRIGSLVLMLGAVCKVFLIDAAVLDGLLRIASFMALGFSLIGIGWVYSRQLKRRAAPDETEPA